MLNTVSIPLMVAMGFIAMFLCKLWMNTRKPSNRARCAVVGSALLLLAVPLATQASVVFQADFNGSSGSTIGQSNSIVTLGGTAALMNGGYMTDTIETASPFFTGQPGYLHMVDSGGVAYIPGGVTFYPSSAAASMDSWFVLQSGTMAFNQINGAVDFFFRSNLASSGWTNGYVNFRPIDLTGGNGGIRFIINGTPTNLFTTEMVFRNSAGTVVQNPRPSGTYSIAANTLYHMAVTISTNPTTGIVTIKTFLAQGNMPIDTTTNTYLISTGTTTAAISGTGTNAVNHAFNSTSGFGFGQVYGYNYPDVKAIDFASFRIYNSVPAMFDAVAYLPDVPNVAKPNPEPTLPSAFELFSPHVIASGTAPANTPIGGEWTRTANPTDGLIIAGNLLTSYTGTNACKDSAYLCYGQNASSIQSANAAIERQVGDNAAIRLDGSLPASSMYLIWPRNANGYGVPMVVNQTEAWWIGPDIATRGNTTSLYGRNLTYSISGTASSNAWIYIKPQGSGTGQWVTPTAVNPYKVDFTVPSNLTNGTYEVWGHNGHGGHYGWSGPMLLTVNDGITWTATQFNVKNAPFNAVGDGVTNDTNAIRAALTAAGTSAYSTVYFPAGTYMINGSLDSPRNVRWLGAGATTSIIKFMSGERYWSVMCKMPTGTSNVTISNLGLDAGASIHSYLVNASGPSPSWVTVSDCILTGTGDSSEGIIYFYSPHHITLKNIMKSGGDVCFSEANQCFVDGCTFNGMWGSTLLNITGSSSQMSYTNNVGQDYDYYMGYAYDPATSSYAGDPNANGWCQGPFFKGLNCTGARHNTYFGNNVDYNMGTHTNNWGEQISFEGNFGQYYGTPTAATGTSVTFAPSTMSGSNTTVTSGTLAVGTSMIAVIIHGTGQGQWRDVGSIDITTGLVTLAAGQSWNVPPDTSSTLVLGWFVANVACYQNHFDGKPDRVGPNGTEGAIGFLPYGGVFNAICDSNLYTYCGTGLRVISMVPRETTARSLTPDYFHLYINNKMQNCQKAIEQNLSTSFTFTNTLEMAATIGNVYRNNTASNTVAGSTLHGIFMDAQPNGSSDAMDFTLFEKNNITDTPSGINCASGSSIGQQGNILFLHNTISKGSATSATSTGIKTVAGTKVGFGGNSYTDFATTYAGTPPGALMEAPCRVVETSASRAKGVSATGTVTVWNGGSSSVAWSATDDQTWLTVSPASGTVTDENGESTFTVTCAPGTLTDGTYTGTVTLTCGTQTKKVEVLFTVIP